MRVVFYMFMKRLRSDIKTQQNGFVVVWYDFSYAARFETDLITKSIQFVAGMPWKLASVHYCTSNNSGSSKFMALAQFVMGREGRLRFRAHHGSHQELHYSLLSFGIQATKRAGFPIGLDGVFDATCHRQWLEEQRKIENQCVILVEEGSTIGAPRHTDVLCGRGRPYQEHPANILLGDLVLEREISYRSLKRGGKSELCHQIMSLMEVRYRTRFIRRRGDGVWEVVSKDDAKEKISQAFRNMFKKQKSISETSFLRDANSATPLSASDEEGGAGSIDSRAKRQRIQDQLDLLSL